MPSSTSAPDPIPEPASERKKPRRWLLFAPYAALVLLAGAYGAFWFVVRGRIDGAIEARAQALRQAGYTVDLGMRRVEGFPFRLKVRQADARITTPGGWSVSVPDLQGEAYLHDVGHWVLVAPRGLSVGRPEGGGLVVTGEALRASVAGVDRDPWRVVLQGTKLVFTPPPGARPFSLAGADLVELYLKPAPSGPDGLTLFRLEGGKAAPETLLYALAGSAAVTATFNGTLGHASGRLDAIEGTATAGKVTAKAKGGSVGIGADGQLSGTVPLQITRAADALTALGQARQIDPTAAQAAAAVARARASGETTGLDLVFQAGATTLGPVRIGPSPKVG